MAKTNCIMRLVFGILPIFLAHGVYASFRDFGLPASTSTVDVRVFNVANATVVNASQAFLLPVLPGHESTTFTAHSFLVEHTKSHKRLIVAGLITSGLFHFELDKDIPELLQDGGITLSSIDAVIWSHSHFDHIGDMSKFPNTTGLVIGSATDTSTYPEFANASLQASDFADHKITKLDFANASLTFSGLKAVDYFGDGSFYLLDTPGHMSGHLTALARVTPSSFIVLGGDSFHHAGEVRPRPQFQKNFPCPAHLLEEATTSISTDYFWSPRSRDRKFDVISRAQPLLRLSDLPDSFYADPVKAEVSLDKLASFDADPDFFVVAAHDLSLRSSLPYFPASLSGWKASRLKEKAVWNFIDKANPSFALSPTNGTQ
ncbi:Metallo-beta-lactamase superfamily protein [Mycena venus]|uniref:Metallo-beta-lactamase superfamily protein n=1 Tax=Mycena venus TaxID=2733690 RepID=A0A8H6YDG3_9AGAR|nr:Metallo-beta-lactamase superfamily protein [Mycena venus]